MKTLNNLTSRVALLIVCCLCSVSATFAASGTSKQINDIKRSGTCFHAESTAASKDEATKAATQMLSYHINSYIKDNGLNVPSVSTTSIPGIKYIDMKRGSNIRVFAYVEKKTIIGDELPSKPAVEEEDIPTPAPTPAPAPAPAPQPVHEPEPTPAPEVETMYDGYSDSVAVYEEADDVSADELVNTPLVRTYIATLESLLNAGSLKNALSQLNRFQAERIVKRYGPYAKCRNKTWTFWLIYDSTGTTLEGFLSPGNEGERLNILNNREDDSLANYMKGQGKVAVWFELR